MLSNSFRWGPAGWITVPPDDRLVFMNITALTLLKLQNPICSSHVLPKAWSGFAASGLCHAQGKDGLELHSCNVLSANGLRPYSVLAPTLFFLTMQEVSMYSTCIFKWCRGSLSYYHLAQVKSGPFTDLFLSEEQYLAPQASSLLSCRVQQEQKSGSVQGRVFCRGS